MLAERLLRVMLRHEGDICVDESAVSATGVPPMIRVAAGEDRFGEHRGLGISTIEFKVAGLGSGGLLVLRTFSTRKVVPHGTHITTRTSGSTRSRASFFSK